MIKVSLIISVIGFIMLVLSIARAEALYRAKHDNILYKKVPLIYWVRMVIMFLIPLVNVVLLLVFSWCFLFAKDNWFENNVFNGLKK